MHFSFFLLFLWNILSYKNWICIFSKVNSNTTMHGKMYFIDKYQGTIEPNIVYYTELNLSRKINYFDQIKYPSRSVLLKKWRFKGFILPSWMAPFPLNCPIPSQLIYINSLQKCFFTQRFLLSFLIDKSKRAEFSES